MACGAPARFGEESEMLRGRHFIYVFSVVLAIAHVDLRAARISAHHRNGNVASSRREGAKYSIIVK